MQVVMYTGRPKPFSWAEIFTSAKPTYQVCASLQQARRTLESATSFINGRDPKGTAPG